MLRGISTRCRRESTARNRARKTFSSLCNIEDFYALATSGYLAAEDSACLVEEALREVEEVRKSIGKGSLDNGTLERLDNAEDKLNNFSAETELQRFGDMPSWEVSVYQRVLGALATLSPSPRSAMETIESVFAESSKAGQNGSGINPVQRAGNDSQAKLAVDDTGALTPR